MSGCIYCFSLCLKTPDIAQWIFVEKNVYRLFCLKEDIQKQKLQLARKLFSRSTEKLYQFIAIEEKFHTFVSQLKPSLTL